MRVRNPAETGVNARSGLRTAIYCNAHFVLVKPRQAWRLDLRGLQISGAGLNLSRFWKGGESPLQV